MRIWELPVADVREPLTAQRRRLLSLLGSLSDTQWAAPTMAPEWSVKDIASHLLGVDLGWLARNRDHERAGILAMSSGHEEFVRGLARLNQRWVDGARMLSPNLITDLLRWSGEQLDAHLTTLDLGDPSSGNSSLWGIHVSGVDVIGTQRPEVGASAHHQMLWPLRLNGDPKARFLPVCREIPRFDPSFAVDRGAG